MLDRARHLLLGLVHVHRHQLLLGLVGLLGGLAVEEVGGEGDEALLGEAVDHAADAVVQAPPLLQHDQPRALALGLGQIALGGASVRGELDFRHLLVLLVLIGLRLESSSASAQPTATPTIMPIRASSASRVRTAAMRSYSSGVVAALSTPASCDSPNQPPASSASASTSCSLRRRLRDGPLGLLEGLGLGDRVDRRVDPLVGVPGLGHLRNIPRGPQAYPAAQPWRFSHSCAAPTSR